MSDLPSTRELEPKEYTLCDGCPCCNDGDYSGGCNLDYETKYIRVKSSSQFSMTVSEECKLASVKYGEEEYIPSKQVLVELKEFWI